MSSLSELPARPDIEHVAVLRTQFLDPARAGIRIGARAIAIDRDQRRLDVRLHPRAVAADIDDRALLDHAPDLYALGCDQMLHIGLLPVETRERGMELGDAVRRKTHQLVGVEKILIGMAAAEEQ